MKFECKKCGKCCHLKVFVTPIDVNNWIKKRRFDIISKLVWDVNKQRKVNPLLMIPQKDGKCIFLNEKNLCTIYEDRPETCRWFPYNKLDFNCPGRSQINQEDVCNAFKFIKRKQKMNWWIAKNEKFFTKLILHAKRKVFICQ